ncbi:MAG: glutamate synthase subunit beta [Oscillospiraceae bacterium]|nr:glutamate synthase subunit beta [Oscillospiraceae bacterium]
MKDGFMRYDRIDNFDVKPLDRINNYKGLHTPLDEDKRREQAARCMNCGVPFCQAGVMLNGMFAGCPLGNLCPEWNELIARGMWNEAADRLLLTSSFPEFTGRVCPALCEKACTNGLDGKAVTVRDNELSVIERAFETGYIKAVPPVERTGKRVAVIGSGPSGLACAQMLNRYGHTVTVYEREDRPGGLLMYGIPNMKLEKDIVLRRIHLLEEEGITFVCGTEIGKDITADEILSGYDAVVLCCGSTVPRDIKAEGREADGIYFAVDFLKAATKSLMRTDISDGDYISAKYKNVIIIGGGDTGNDCAATCIRQGCRSVTQLEMMPKPPEQRAQNNPWPEWPKVLKTDYGQEESIAVFGRDPRVYQKTVRRFIADEDNKLRAVETVSLTFEHGRPEQIEGSEEIIPAELVLIAAGFVGAEDKLTNAFGAGRTQRGTITTEAGHYRVNDGKLFTAGDAHRGQSLVVWAIKEGRDCAKEVNEYLSGNIS